MAQQAKILGICNECERKVTDDDRDVQHVVGYWYHDDCWARALRQLLAPKYG